MKIVIPSYKRYLTPLKTIKNIPRNWYEKTTVYVRTEEYDNYRSIIPDEIQVTSLIGVTDIKSTRNAIMNLIDGDVLMLDDDLDFSELVGKKYKNSNHESINKMFSEIQTLFQSGFVHVSVACPVVGLPSKGRLIHNARYYAVLGYRLDVLKKLKIRFRTTFMEDFDVGLQLIRRGFPSAILTNWLINTVANTSGGCSVLRDSENALKSALTLQKAHQGFVKVVPKSSWKNMDNRFDVRIQWKKAFESAKIKNIPRGYNI